MGASAHGARVWCSPVPPGTINMMHTSFFPARIPAAAFVCACRALGHSVLTNEHLRWHRAPVDNAQARKRIDRIETSEPRYSLRPSPAKPRRPVFLLPPPCVTMSVMSVTGLRTSNTGSSACDHRWWRSPPQQPGLPSRSQRLRSVH